MDPADYVEALAEIDYYMAGVPLLWGRKQIQKNYTDEQIRELWWYAIGQHDEGLSSTNSVDKYTQEYIISKS